MNFMSEIGEDTRRRQLFLQNKTRVYILPPIDFSRAEHRYALKQEHGLGYLTTLPPATNQRYHPYLRIPSVSYQDTTLYASKIPTPTSIPAHTAPLYTTQSSLGGLISAQVPKRPGREALSSLPVLTNCQTSQTCIDLPDLREPYSKCSQGTPILPPFSTFLQLPIATVSTVNSSASTKSSDSNFPDSSDTTSCITICTMNAKESEPSLSKIKKCVAVCASSDLRQPKLSLTTKTNTQVLQQRAMHTLLKQVEPAVFSLLDKTPSQPVVPTTIPSEFIKPNAPNLGLLKDKPVPTTLYSNQNTIQVLSSLHSQDRKIRRRKARNIGDQSDRPHACNVDGCDRKFAKSGNLQRHMRIHDRLEGLGKAYSCLQCPLTFDKKDHLGWHIMVRHPKWWR